MIRTGTVYESGAPVGEAVEFSDGTQAYVIANSPSCGMGKELFKYSSYYSIRWDDEPPRAARPQEKL